MITAKLQRVRNLRLDALEGLWLPTDSRSDLLYDLSFENTPVPYIQQAPTNSPLSFASVWSRLFGFVKCVNYGRKTPDVSVSVWIVYLKDHLPRTFPRMPCRHSLKVSYAWIMFHRWVECKSRVCVWMWLNNWQAAKLTQLLKSLKRSERERKAIKQTQIPPQAVT